MPRHLKTQIIGLTGSIGMGKSTALKMFKACGLLTLSADEIVHELYQADGKGTRRIAKFFPSAVGPKGVDRQKLAALVLNDETKIKKIEQIIHPLVFQVCRAFIVHAKKDKAKGVVLDIPLLFETGFDRKCDTTVCVTAPASVQKERVLKRKGMTAAKLRAILKNQMSSREKKARAAYVIRSDKGFASMRGQITNLCATLFPEG